MEENVCDVKISAEEEKRIAQQTNDLVTFIVGMVNKLSEEGVFPKLPDDDMYKVADDVKVREIIDKTADAAKNALARYDENKNMPQLKWYKFAEKIKQKNQKEENQREIINELITAVDNNAEASKLLFNYIIHLSTYSRKLLALGLGGIACNRIVVREVRARMKDASESEIDQLAQQELLLVLDELEKQNALEIKIDNVINNLSHYVEKENVYTKDEVDNKFTEVYTKDEVDDKLTEVYTKDEVDQKIKYILIAYGITTATLLAGLIASFLI